MLPGEGHMENVGQNGTSTTGKGPSRGKLVILAGVIGMGAACGYLHYATPLYRSTATVFLELQRESDDGPLPAHSDLLNRWFYTQAERIRSRWMMSTAREDPNMKPLVASRSAQYVTDILWTLSTSVHPEAGTIVVSACSTIPEDASRVVSAVVRTFTQHYEPSASRIADAICDSLGRDFDRGLQTLKSNLEQMRTYEQENAPLVRGSTEVSPEDLDFAKVGLASAGLQALDPGSYKWLQQFDVACSLASGLVGKAADHGQRFLAMIEGEGPESADLSQQHLGYKQVVSDCVMLAERFQLIYEYVPCRHCSSPFKVHVLKSTRPAAQVYRPRPLPVYGIGLIAGLLLSGMLCVAQRRIGTHRRRPQIPLSV